MKRKIYIVLLSIIAALILTAIILLFLWAKKHRISSKKLHVDTLYTEKKIETNKIPVLKKYKIVQKEYEKTTREKTITKLEKKYLAVETIPKYDTTKALFTTSPIYIEVDSSNKNLNKCIVKAYIDPNGNVVDASIFSSSGNREIDNKALSTVKSMFFPVYNFKIKETFPWILVPVEFK